MSKKLMQKHKPLTKKHKEAIRLIVEEGYTQAQAGAAVGLTQQTISGVMHRDDVQQMLYRSMREVFVTHAVKAARKIVSQIDSDNEWVAQNASRETVNQVESYNKQSDNQIVVNFGAMPAPAMPPATVAETDGEVK